MIFYKFSFGYYACTVVSDDAVEAAASMQSLKKDEDKNVFTCHGNPWECRVGGRRAATFFEGLFCELKKECVCPSQFSRAC